eukprot:gene23447-biopygen14379
MSHVFGHHAQHLVEVLERKAGQSVEIQAPLYHFTFDTINSVAFNRRVSSQGGNAADCAFETAFDAFTNCVVSRFLVPWWKLNRALQLTAEERTIKHSTKVLNDYVNNVVNEYVDEHGNVLPAAEVSDDQTLMDLYLQHALEEGKRYTRKFLRFADFTRRSWAASARSARKTSGGLSASEPFANPRRDEGSSGQLIRPSLLPTLPFALPLLIDSHSPASGKRQQRHDFELWRKVKLTLAETRS